jgi:hypothetical protein
MCRIAIILLLSSFAVAELPDAPQPHLEMTRPATVPPDHPDKKPESHKWSHRGIEAGSAGLAAKLADDSCDLIIGPTKARYVAAAAAVITYVVVHHCLRLRRTRQD